MLSDGSRVRESSKGVELVSCGLMGLGRLFQDATEGCFLISEAHTDTSSASDHALRITRTINGTPQHLFYAWEKPDGGKRW